MINQQYGINNRNFNKITFWGINQDNENGEMAIWL